MPKCAISEEFRWSPLIRRLRRRNPLIQSPLVVAIPPPAGGSGVGTPTGVIFNDTPDFVVVEGTCSGPASFIFAIDDGTLAGWNPEVNSNLAHSRMERSPCRSSQSFSNMQASRSEWTRQHSGGR